MSSDSSSTIMARIESLAAVSESASCLTRRYLSPEHERVNALVGQWMRDAGMQTHTDSVGNIVGRLEGTTPGQPALMFGSHLDTVADAGRYDGMLGVLTPIACVADIVASGVLPDFAIEVIGFADEEGLRFQSTLLGSRAVAGTFDHSLIEREDANGVTMAAALEQFGLDVTRIGEAARSPAELHAYVELHIEQGPVLEDRKLPVGVVTAIAGATRLEVRVTGEAGHAGTVPMGLRRDALNAAALMVCAIEERCLADPALVGTVGRFEVGPGAVNVIPGDVVFSIDIRAGDDAKRITAVDDVIGTLHSIASDRRVKIDITPTHANDGCQCAPWLIEQLGAAVTAEGIEVLNLPSGAGHDAMAIAGITDVGMLFVRCEGGVSHNPNEEILEEDAEIGRQVLTRFIQNFEPKR